MAVFFESLNSSSAGVVDGEFTSAEFVSTGAFTFHTFGTFDSATVQILLSTYATGGSDVYSPILSAMAVGTAERVDVDAGCKVKVKVMNLSATSSVTATSGGGN